MEGDFAMTIHGNNRFTPIINRWIEDSLENRVNLRKAFNNAGYGGLLHDRNDTICSRLDRFSIIQSLTRYYSQYERP